MRTSVGRTLGVVALILPFVAEAASAADASRAPVENSIGMRLVSIPAGKFLMGPTDAEKNNPFEPGKQRVKVAEPFLLGAYEVTQQEFATVMGRNPSFFSKTAPGGMSLGTLDPQRFPVEQVSWFDAIEFCNRLSEKEKLTAHYKIEAPQRDEAGALIDARVTIAGGNGYRLPSEVEWEYACRAGTDTPFSFGSTLNGTQANADGGYPYGSQRGPALGRTTTAGSYKPNAFGLYDMHGNVWEWCWDAYQLQPNLERLAPGNPAPAASGAERINRGGSFFFLCTFCRSAYRGKNSPATCVNTTGFRVARNDVRN
jgi:formylglycine-generating enzyme required for sulfatase activity